MHRPIPVARHRLIALFAALTLALGSSGCVLWAFHERNKAIERQKKPAVPGRKRSCRRRIWRAIAVRGLGARRESTQPVK